MKITYTIEFSAPDDLPEDYIQEKLRDAIKEVKYLITYGFGIKVRTALRKPNITK
jgi:hypothetical protein